MPRTEKRPNFCVHCGREERDADHPKGELKLHEWGVRDYPNPGTVIHSCEGCARTMRRAERRGSQR